jgi:L,D-transpeptidase YcbB
MGARQHSHGGTNPDIPKESIVIPGPHGVARLLVILALCLCAPTPHHGSSALAQTGGPPAPSSAATQIRLRIERGSLPSLRWPEFPYYSDEMERLYAPAGNQPIWLVDGKPRVQVEDVIRILREAGTRGLPVEDYDVDLLASGWDGIASGAISAAPDLADLDAATSLLLMRHISDIHIGRINPKNLGYGLEIEPKKYDLAALVRDGIDRNRLPQLIEEAEPQLYQYRALKAALEAYRTLAEDPTLVPPAEAGTLRPGDPYEAISQLAHLLKALGDMPADAIEKSTYTGTLVEGIKRFQARHGLTEDGVIGPRTWAHLRTPLRWRLRQIEMALERLRWLPEMPPGPLLVVNIPAFKLYAFDTPNAAGRPVLQMNVVVGKAARYRTPVFADRMRYVVFSPYWYPTRSIIRGEILPAIDRDPEYLAKSGMELVPSTSDDARPLPTTPDNIEKLRSGRITVRERPGDRNSLGLVKFIFPNSHNVYLHDTPSRGLFARERRDFSHGCIRLEKPLDLAAWVLRDQPEWSRERILEAMHAGTPKQVPLASPVPIYLLYTTAIARPDGSIVFYEDIYGFDEGLNEALLEGEPYAP